MGPIIIFFQVLELPKGFYSIKETYMQIDHIHYDRGEEVTYEGISELVWY